MACSCGDKKCTVAALEAKTAGLKERAEASPSNRFSSRSTREEKWYRDHLNRLANARWLCSERKRLIAIGPICPLCLRPVVPQSGGEGCWIGGPFVWRGDQGGERAERQRECQALAWARLTEARP